MRIFFAGLGAGLVFAALFLGLTRLHYSSLATLLVAGFVLLCGTTFITQDLLQNFKKRPLKIRGKAQ